MMLAMLIILFFLFMVLGMPIAFTMGASAAFTFMYAGIDPMVMAQRTFTSTNSFALMAIPLFMLAGNLMERVGITEELIDFCDKCVGHIRGGLAQTTCLTGILMAAMCGSNNASASAIGSMMIPGLRKEGYDDGFSCSLIAASGNLGPIIPPSIIMIIYASATNMPINRLFMSGMVPGILMGIGFMVYCNLHAKRIGMVPKKRAKAKEVWKAFFALMTPVIILVGIMSGAFTATESGAIAVLYSALYGLARKRLTLKDMVESLYQAAISTLGPMVVICFAAAFSYLLTYCDFAEIMVNFIISISTNPYVVLLLIMLLITILGMFVEVTAALIMMIPMFTSIVNLLGYDPLYFAIVVIITFCIGAITPPVGITLYVSCGIAKLPLKKAIKPIWPFVFIMLGVTVLIVFVPGVATLLPNLLGL